MKEITSTIRNYSLGFVLLGCIGSMSCTREADFDMEGAGTEEVAFSAAIGQASRRGDNAWTGGELVGMKVGDETRTYFVSDATTGAMSTDGEPYTWAAESGNYELHAWSPLTAESIALTDQSDADKMFACDLVDCKTTVNAQAVQLTFKHKMTRVWYELQVFTDYTDADADAADITFYGYKNVRYSEGTVTAEGNPDAEISPRKTDNRHGEAFLVPGEMWDKPLIKVVIAGDTYIYTPKHSVQTDEERQTGVLKEGYNQRYYLKVSKKGLEVTMESSSVGWDSETMDDVTDGKYKVETPAELTGAQLTGIENGFITSTDKTFSISYTESGNGGLLYEGNCDVKRTTDGTTHTYAFSKVASDIKITYTADYLKVGKYYYSNGTFGDEAVKEGCETVGLVYKLGASSNDYDTDKIDYYDESELKSITGYIVSLVSPTNNISWATGDNLETQFGSFDDTADEEKSEGNMYKGYIYTKAMESVLNTPELVAKSPFWTAFKNMNLGTPEGTSGWYIPSVAQLQDIAASEITTQINFIGSYYSSNVYHVNVNSGMDNPHGNNINDHSYVLRYNVGDSSISADYPSDANGKLIVILTF